MDRQSDLSSRRMLPLACGLLALLLGTAACGTTSNSPTAATAPTDTPTTAATASTDTPNAHPAITITDGAGRYSTFAFAPSTIIVYAGTPIVWTNTSSTAHTVTSDAGTTSAFDSGPIATGHGVYQLSLTTPGTYTYHCRFHPFMKASIVVVPLPYG